MLAGYVSISIKEAPFTAVYTDGESGVMFPKAERKGRW